MVGDFVWSECSKIHQYSNFVRRNQYQVPGTDTSTGTRTSTSTGTSTVLTLLVPVLVQVRTRTTVGELFVRSKFFK